MSEALASRRIAKYDVPGPRYSSYPTVPYWEETPPTEAQWLERLGKAVRAGIAAGEGAALYVHLPFCRSLCTYCGCNTRITRTHTVVMPYVRALLAEYALYRERLGIDRPALGELHLGGGTPTFLEPDELEALLAGLLGASRLQPGASLSIEVDPRVTSPAHLQLLARHGFRHISMGVQDFDPTVQEIVNRMQSVAQVRTVSEQARALGFTSVNYDLIYGLPLQTPASIELTMDAVSALKPDRIAFYGYVHVPWIKSGQRRFTEADLPEGAARHALYERGRQRLAQAGYREIGLDYYVLASDSLWQAACAGHLHRNFMGYSQTLTRPLLGLGVSSLGDAGDAYAQNEKEILPYQERIARGELPIHRGHLLDAEDQVLRRHILNLMTRLETHWRDDGYTPWLAMVSTRLAEFAADGLVTLETDGCRVTEAGRGFLRNICMAFDARLARRSPQRPLYRRSA